MKYPLTLFALFAAGSALIADEIRLDFGTPQSAVRKGFTRVSEKAVWGPDTLAGWLQSSELSSRDLPVSREWKYRESTGRSAPPAIFTTSLSQDHVESARAGTLRVRVTPGEYRIWLCCGAAGGSSSQVWDIAVRAGSAHSRATFPGPYASRTQELQVQSPGNSLDIQFSSRSRWLVNALIIAPASEWEDVRTRLIGPIERELFLLPPEELEKWKLIPHRDDSPPPEFTPEEEKHGLVVYARHYLEPVWPATKPKRREIASAVRAFAARNEYEPMTFTIYPLRDFREIQVRVSDLTSKQGKRITRAQIDLRYVRYMNVRPNYRVRGIYYRAPDVLMPMQPRPLSRHENFRVWMTVHIDAFAPEGIYTGTAEVLEAGQVLARVPLVFRTLPFLLQQDRSLAIGQYYHHPYSRMKTAPDAFSRNWWARKAELEHADMAAHGNNTLTMGLWSPAPVNGNWRFNFDDLAAAIDLYRRHGFYQPIPLHIPTSSVYAKYMKKGMGSHLRLVKMPPAPFFEEMTDMVRTIEAERKCRQWPDVLYYPVDEPSTRPESVAFMAAVLKAIKKVPGARTYVTADPTHDQFLPMRPYVDVWCCQPFNPDRETILADMKKHGIEYWCYPNHVAGENDHTPVAGARMTYGFGLWRSGFRALIPWIYQANIADPWNYLDGGAMDFFNRTGDNAEPIPVVMWEAYREGLDDHRYLTTLEAWIERAAAAGLRKEAALARAERDFIWNSIQVQTKYKYEDLWAPEAFDVYRWILANAILKLRASLARQ